LIEVRPARPDDDRALSTIDRETWSTLTSPAPPPAELDWSFFREKIDLQDVLVAVVDGEVAGYVRIAHPFPLESSGHVLHVTGIAVGPAFQRRGVGQALVEAAIDESRSRGARRLTLRVLAHNEAAVRLYERCGFVVEGVLRGEFFLDGNYVDDMLMAVDLTA
jgi:ribosomal protein S18 acetylase RimI-like enzyme